MEYVKRLLLVLHWLALVLAVGCLAFSLSLTTAWLIQGEDALYDMLNLYEGDLVWLVAAPWVVGPLWLMATATLRFIVEGAFIIFPWQTSRH